MRLVPLILLVNLGFLGTVVRGMMVDPVQASPSADVLETLPVTSDVLPSLQDLLPLPGMEDWNPEDDSCAAMEAFLQAASVELERKGHQPPIRPGQQILRSGGLCSLEEKGSAQLIGRYRQAFEDADLFFPVERP